MQIEITIHHTHKSVALKILGACGVGMGLSYRHLLLTGLHLQQGSQSRGALLPNWGAGRLEGVRGNGPGHL